MVKCPKCNAEMEHVNAEWSIIESDFATAYIRVERKWVCRRDTSEFTEKVDKQVNFE